MTTTRIGVEATATVTELDVAVTADYSGNGTAVNYSTQSDFVILQNIGSQGDIWYQVGSGSFVQLLSRQSTQFDIDFSATTLKLKRGEFAPAKWGTF